MSADAPPSLDLFPKRSVSIKAFKIINDQRSCSICPLPNMDERLVERERGKDVLAVYFLSVNGMTSWKPNTIISGESTDFSTSSKKWALATDPFRSVGLAESMFHVQIKTLTERNVQNDD